MRTGAPVLAEYSRVAALQGRLGAGGEHHGAGVPVALQGIQEGRREAEVALHELGLFLGPVHAGEVEDEVGV